MARRKLDVSFGAKRVKPEEELESGLPREMRDRPKRRERKLAVKPSLLDYIRTGSEVAQGIRPENIPMTGMRAGKQLGPAIGGGLSALYDYARSTAPGQVVSDVLGAPARLGASIRQNPSMLYELIPGSGTVQGIREGAQRLAEGDPEAMRNAAALAAFAGAMDVIPGGGKGANLAVRGAKELAEEGVDLGVKRAVENAPKLRIKPSPDDVNEVMQANTSAGRVVGNRTRNIDELTGGVSRAADDQRRVDALVKEMSSPNGYISRLIVDDAGNVIEGQHRLEALRRLGVKDVPVTEYKDFERDIDFPALKDAIRSAQPMHSDNVNQLAASIAETYADEGGNLSEIAQYEPPKGFEQGWQAGIDALSFKPTESSLSVSKVPATATPTEEGVDLGVKRAVRAAPESPLHEITMDYGRDIARRVRDYIDPDAPLSEYRDMAERFAAAANSNFAARPEPSFSVRPAQIATDPRIESRKGELPKIQSLEMELQPRVMDPIPEVSIFDMEGKPYITSMADLAAAGDDIISINGVKFRVPFSRRGGQDYMFDNPGSVWASEKGVARGHVGLANRLFNEYGEHPIYLPWTMGPKAVQFSHQPRGIQYNFIDAALGAKERGGLGDQIRAILPDWRDFEDPESADMFMSATGKARSALNKLMDRYRTQGGLGLGEATYAATDLSQIGAPLMTLRNVGVIDPSFAASPSSHPSYSFHVPGYGLGRLKEPNIGVLALNPELMERLGYNSPFDYPVGVVPGVENPRRKYETQIQSGLITDKALRLIERLQDQGLINP